jgi:hypothetical protein
MPVIDVDAHVIETAATFADSYWDPAFADRRPRRGAGVAVRPLLQVSTPTGFRKAS